MDDVVAIFAPDLVVAVSGGDYIVAGTAVDRIVAIDGQNLRRLVQDVSRRRNTWSLSRIWSYFSGGYAGHSCLSVHL